MKLVTEEDFRAYAKSNPFMEYNHISIVSVSPDRCVVKVDAMADCVAGIISRTDGADYVTQSAHMNFLHNVQSGTLYAAAETVRRGHKLAIFHVTVTDEKGDLLIDGVVDMFRITP